MIFDFECLNRIHKLNVNQFSGCDYYKNGGVFYQFRF